MGRGILHNMLKNRILTFILDLVFLIIICAFSYFLIRFYQDANFIKTGYADWIVHGFRVKSIDQIGFTSWNHMWSNGANIWKGYQFIPHIITLGIVKLFHVGYLRAMVLLTIIFFCLLHIQIYIISRFLGARPIVSFIASIISVSIGQFWGNINDYSLFIGVSFSPLLIFLWVLYQKKKIGIIFPFIVGLSFCIHPILGFYFSMLLIFTYFFSDKKIKSLNFLLEIAVFLAGSSLFWAPLIFKDGYSYTDPEVLSIGFLSQQVKAYGWLGTSLSIIILYLVNWLQIFFDEKIFPRWSKILLVYVLIMFAFIYIGINVSLPPFFYVFQHTRGMGILGIVIILTSIPLLNKILEIKNFIFLGFLLIIFSLAFVESVWIASTYSANPGKYLEDPLQKYVKLHKNSDILTSRIWAGNIDTTSYISPQTVRISYDYIGHLEPNMIPPRLISLIYYQPYGDYIPPIAMNRISNYFKLTGTKYMFFDDTSVFTKSFLNRDYSYGYKNLGQITLTDSLWHAFQVPWRPIESAVLTNNQLSRLSLFPSKLNFSNPKDQLKMDELIQSMANVIYSKETIPLTPKYPGPEDITINIPVINSNVMLNSFQHLNEIPKQVRDDGLRYVYINESYSNSWTAVINGQAAKVSPIGPYYMLITMPKNVSGVLYMHHYWPLSYHIAVVLLGMSVLIILFNGIIGVFKFRHHELVHDSESD